MRVALLSSLLILAGCQTLHDSGPGDTPLMLSSWNLDGRFGYRTGDDGGSASVAWRQRDTHGELHFSGPLGIGSAHLSWQPGLAELETGKETVTARTTEELTWRLTGLNLPVEALQYWVRGLPWPHTSAIPIFNQNGNISLLEQAGWQLEFDRYGAVDGLQLPFRVRAQHADQRFTLIIKEWEPLP